MITALDLNTLHLDEGAHPTPDAGLCLLEAVAYVAGEPHTDAPACVSPVLAAYGRGLNDCLPDGRRQELKRFVPLLPGTAGDGLDERRSYLALDWLVRTYTPAFLDLRPELAGAADGLRGLDPVVDLATAEAARPVVDAATDAAADAAWDAATDAARYAAQSAATDAAWSAATDAARYAAQSAATDAAGYAATDAAGYAATAAVGYAAWSAARHAAWAAATDAATDAAWSAARHAAAEAVLQPTVDRLQTSAIDLFERMINPAKV